MVLSAIGILGVGSSATGVGGGLGRVISDIGVDGLGVLLSKETVFYMSREVLSLLRWRTLRS